MPNKLSKKENLAVGVKFLLISFSAGAIQTFSFTLLSELIFHDKGSKENPVYGWSYFIALMLSFLWNFTFNRRYTFKSANNVPVAMLKVFGYYCVFTPASVWWGVALTGLNPGSRLLYYAVFTGTMAVNCATEFLFQRFVVYRDSIDTNGLAIKTTHGEKT
jgi:putative flippase GtrA